MAERIRESNYQAMLDALYNFAGRAASLSSNMQTLALVVSSALEDEDTAVPAIYKQVRDCSVKYSSLATQALHIASAISKELEMARKESAAWSDDE